MESRTQLPHVERELFRVFPFAIRPKLVESVTKNESEQHMWMDIMGNSVSVIQLVNTSDSLEMRPFESYAPDLSIAGIISLMLFCNFNVFT